MSNRETLINSRKKRIEILKEMLENNPEKPLKEILANFCIETGIRAIIAEQYYNLLIEAKKIEPRNA